MVGWGFEGVVIEFKSDGILIFYVYMDLGDFGVGVENYCVFRYNWIGIFNEVLVVVVLENDEGIIVYVLWNGDIEIIVWCFYVVIDMVGFCKFLGEVLCMSFEISFKIKGKKIKVL